MLRTEWKFNRTAADLAIAAQTKKEHHLERIAWWEDQKAKVMAEVKETGIEVTESLAANYSNTSMGHGPQVMVRTDLQQKLTECFNKIKEHDKKATDYAGWEQVMHNAIPGTFDLHHEDWLFFFGK